MRDLCSGDMGYGDLSLRVWSLGTPHPGDTASGTSSLMFRATPPSPASLIRGWQRDGSQWEQHQPCRGQVPSSLPRAPSRPDHLSSLNHLMGPSGASPGMELRGPMEGEDTQTSPCPRMPIPSGCRTRNPTGALKKRLLLLPKDLAGKGVVKVTVGLVPVSRCPQPPARPQAHVHPISS